MITAAQLAEWTISVLSITGSRVDDTHGAVLVGGTGTVGSIDPDDDSLVEQAQDAEAFGAPGVVWRPRAPETVSLPSGGTDSVGAEAVAVRGSEGALPLAWRDLRWNRKFPAPAAGTVAFVGYGGGFLSFNDTDSDSGSEKASICVWYCPHSYDSAGVAQSAHAIILDPTEGISIVHAAGQSLTMTPDGSAQLTNGSGSAYLSLQPDGNVTIQAVQLVLNAGGVVIGNPAGALVPLAAGAASPPCPRLFLNPAS